MKILERFQIKGRGPVLSVHKIETEVPVPVGLRAADGTVWKVRGVERFCMRIGLPSLLVGESVAFLVPDDCPLKAGDEVEFVLPEVER